MKSSTLAFIVAVACTGSLPAAARTFALNDYYALAGVSEVQISPDGTSIAYIRSFPNPGEDRFDRVLVLRDLKTGGERPLTGSGRDGQRGISSPAWSPDGTRIAYLADEGTGKDARRQIFVMDMHGGAPRPISRAPRGVEQFAWRPDGTAIAYVAPEPPGNQSDLDNHLDGFVVGDQSYQDKAAPLRNRIWLLGADGASERQLTFGDFSLPGAEPPGPPGAPISWSPDGKSIAFTRMPNDYDADSDRAVVAVLDVASGKTTTLTSHGKYEGYGVFSPDGSKIAYWYPLDGDLSNQNEIFVAPASGGDGSDVTKSIDANAVRAMWMPDGSLLVAGHSGTDCALWIVPPSAPPRRLDLGGVQPSQSFWLDASVSRTGAIAFAASEPNHPSELYYMASPQVKPQRLTSHNAAIAALELGKVASVTWAAEGFNEDGVLTYPPHYDPAKSYPLVLVVHGGPQSSSSTNFSWPNQLFAARGWLVFNPNYRGSDNLGNAYFHGIFNDAGAGPGRDVMAGIDAVEKLANVDRSRIAVSGWSYGGYMTSWMIGHYHIWKAAVSGAAVNNLVDEYALADNGVGNRFFFPKMSSPWQNDMLGAYIDQSPLTYAWQVTTPTLILSDTGDSRVPVTQSYELYRSLKDRGTPVEFWAYPVAGHFPSDPVRVLDVWRRWSDWIGRYF
jgi:dipeptidyl aminopeptidase/acylaminoacyl peptidase